jgi:hypothetical protein
MSSVRLLSFLTGYIQNQRSTSRTNYILTLIQRNTQSHVEEKTGQVLSLNGLPLLLSKLLKQVEKQVDFFPKKVAFYLVPNRTKSVQIKNNKITKHLIIPELQAIYRIPIKPDKTRVINIPYESTQHAEAHHLAGRSYDNSIETQSTHRGAYFYEMAMHRHRFQSR